MKIKYSAAELAEIAGAEIGCQIIYRAFATANQAEASTAIIKGLNEAFNPDNDPIIDAVAKGISVVIVNILERDRGAITAEGVETNFKPKLRNCEKQILEAIRRNPGITMTELQKFDDAAKGIIRDLRIKGFNIQNHSQSGHTARYSLGAIEWPTPGFFDGSAQ